VAVRQNRIGTEHGGCEEGCDCPEALKGFALSLVPTGGDAGFAQDEGIAALVVVCVYPCAGPQGPKVCPCARVSVLLSAWGCVRESCR